MNAFRRELTALLAVWTFVTATTVIPVVHLFFHSRPHTHSITGVYYQHGVGSASGAHLHPHEHPDDPHSGAGHAHPHVPSPGEELPAGERQDHGAGSSAHFALALNDAPASYTFLFSLSLREAERLESPAAAHLPSAGGGTLRLRGPPAIA